VIKITIEGPQGSGKSTLGMELMLLLASDKMLKKPWIRNAKKASLFLQDEESKTFKRLPYSMLPDVLIVLKQTTENEIIVCGSCGKDVIARNWNTHFCDVGPESTNPPKEVAGPFCPKEKAPFDNLTSTSTEMEDNPPIIPSEYRINLRKEAKDGK